jgi:hypothetical protein
MHLQDRLEGSDLFSTFPAPVGVPGITVSSFLIDLREEATPVCCLLVLWRIKDPQVSRPPAGKCKERPCCCTVTPVLTFQTSLPFLFFWTTFQSSPSVIIVSFSGFILLTAKKRQEEMELRHSVWVRNLLHVLLLNIPPW